MDLSAVPSALVTSKVHHWTCSGCYLMWCSCRHGRLMAAPEFGHLPRTCQSGSGKGNAACRRLVLCRSWRWNRRHLWTDGPASKQQAFIVPVQSVKCMLLSVLTQLFVYCARQLHISATGLRRHQADYKHKMEIFTVAWFDISEAYRWCYVKIHNTRN